MNTIDIFYDAEGDILEIRFGSGQKNRRTGIGLTDQITLFCDDQYKCVLGLTAVAYSKLITLPARPMKELSQSPPEIQTKVKALLKSEPLSHILRLIDNKIQVGDIRVSELVAA